MKHDILKTIVKVEECQNVILEDEEFLRIVNFMKRNYGVNLSKKRTLIVGRLENKMTQRGYSGYGEFISKVEANPKGEEAMLLVNTLTTNHTFFMRESLHFDFMREVALPEIRQKASATRDVRIWSAASSSGEEAYSIVMTLKEFFGTDAPRWDTKVLATDISTRALTAAKEGIYRAEAVEQLPDRWIRQHFIKLPDGDYRVNDSIRNEVIFNTFNLMNPFPFKKPFHIIFLRNVMIYFDEPTKRELVKKMYNALEPGGYMFVGTTETFDRSCTDFENVQPSVYRKPVKA